MSKAEEMALKAYPKMSRISEPHEAIPADNQSHYIGDANAEKREGFINGYHQAEKDLELTWQDIAELCNHILDGDYGKLDEVPVSKDLEEASKEWLKPQLDKSYENCGEVKMMELTHFDGYAMLDAIEFGAKWKEEQEIKYNHRTFLQGEKSVANYILKMIDNGWHINAIYTVCKDKLKED